MLYVVKIYDDYMHEIGSSQVTPLGIFVEVYDSIKNIWYIENSYNLVTQEVRGIISNKDRYYVYIHFPYYDYILDNIEFIHQYEASEEFYYNKSKTLFSYYKHSINCLVSYNVDEYFIKLCHIGRIFTNLKEYDSQIRIKGNELSFELLESNTLATFHIEPSLLSKLSLGLFDLYSTGG